METTLVIVKPEAVAKSLIGNVLTKLSEAKLEMIGCKCVRVHKELAEEHYRHLKDLPFFSNVISYIMGEFHDDEKVVAFIFQGEDAIKKVRDLAGATNPEEADSSTIRGKYGRITTKGYFENVIHASSDAEEAEREIKLWFDPDEIITDIYATKKITDNTPKRTWA